MTFHQMAEVEWISFGRKWISFNAAMEPSRPGPGYCRRPGRSGATAAVFRGR
jgi:hypothetical protein